MVAVLERCVVLSYNGGSAGGCVVCSCNGGSAGGCVLYSCNGGSDRKVYLEMVGC